ncbi:MAG: FecR domain-containing protein [Deltaproteobacteria bacterium]
MRKGLCGFVFLCAACLLAVSVEAATVVAVSGKAEVSADGSSWQPAVSGQQVDGGIQIQCGPGSLCTVAFDAALLDIVTVKENTTVTVEGLEPGRLFLKEGRVFSVVRADGTDPFQVRTPTSSSGARKAAWLTDFRAGRTEVSVFEDSVVVGGCDAGGNKTDEAEVSTGQGISVAADGLLGEIFIVPVEQIAEWHEEKQGIEDLRKAAGLPSGPQESVPQAQGAGKEQEAAVGATDKEESPARGEAAGAAPVAMSEADKILEQMRQTRLEAEQVLGGSASAASGEGLPPEEALQNEEGQPSQEAAAAGGAEEGTAGTVMPSEATQDASLMPDDFFEAGSASSGTMTQEAGGTDPSSVMPQEAETR